MLHVTEQQAMNLEKETRPQSKSKLWFRHMQGWTHHALSQCCQLLICIARPSQSLQKHTDSVFAEYVVRAEEQHEKKIDYGRVSY